MENLPEGVSDPYKFLGIEFHASQGQIKQAYRKKALEIHPDKNLDDPNAKKLFSRLQETYEFLIDENKRKKFDAATHSQHIAFQNVKRSLVKKKPFAADLERKEKKLHEDKNENFESKLLKNRKVELITKETKTWITEKIFQHQIKKKKTPANYHKLIKNDILVFLRFDWETETLYMNNTLKLLQLQLMRFGDYTLQLFKQVVNECNPSLVKAVAIVSTDNRQKALQTALHFLETKNNIFTVKLVRDEIPHVCENNQKSAFKFHDSHIPIRDQMLFETFENRTLNRLRKFREIRKKKFAINFDLK